MDFRALVDAKNSNDNLAALMGIKVIEIQEGYAKAVLVLKQQHLNSKGGAHGGAIMTLMDITGGSAAESYGVQVSTATTSIDFLRPAYVYDTLYATAEAVKNGRTLSVIEVKVQSEGGELVAKGSFTFFRFAGKELQL